MWAVAILTMLVGSIVAITQTDVKRLLAYSSIAQAGYVLTGVVAATSGRPVEQPVLPGRLRLRRRSARSPSSRWSATRPARPRTCPAGPGSASGRRWSPGSSRLFLIAFAGIPLTSGFTGKFAVFQAAIAGGALPLVVVGVHQQRDPRLPLRPRDRADVLQRPGARRSCRGQAQRVHRRRRWRSERSATLVLGIVPQPLLSLANHAATPAVRPLNAGCQHRRRVPGTAARSRHTWRMRVTA